MSDTASHDNATTLHLFDGKPKFEAFCRMQEIVNVSRMAASTTPFKFGEAEKIELPKTYDHFGVQKSLESLIEDTHTSALLVLQNGNVRYENYWLTGGPDVQWLSMSVAKSFISALVGIAISEGLIKHIDESIADYVAGLQGTAYDGVSVKQVLQMSSGARWREDYADQSSEISRMALAFAPDGSLDKFMSTMVREYDPGTVCQYSSGDTQALGMLLRAVTGRSIADYMQEKLCEPLGMESPGYWVVDSKGVEAAFAGTLLTARDFARIGELYRLGGLWNGRQIVPAEYVARSIVWDSPHLAPGQPFVGGHRFPLGYGYQWWIPAGDRGEFSAIGVYNQYVYVDPSRDIVIVKLSANPAYGTSHSDEDNKDEENIFGFRAICREFDRY